MREGIKNELWRMFGVALAAALIGVILGDVILLLFIGVLAYLGWHMFILVRLASGLTTGKEFHTPFPGGIWKDVFEQIRRLQTRNLKRKRKQNRFFSRFREAASAAPDAVVLMGKSGEVEWCNPAAQRMLGLYWPKCMGRTLVSDIQHPVLKEYLTRGNFNRPIEFPSPVNKAVILSLRVTPFGKKHQKLLLARDITQVYHLDQVRRDFVANVSHELRTPLTVITGFLENLASTGSEIPQWTRSIELMQEQAKRMQSIINDLLALSRLDLGNITGTSNPVSVPKLLSAVVQEARALSRDHHELKLECDPELFLKGDEDELHSAFSNLVCNAVQHTPARSLIRIQWYADDAGAHLRVSDNGQGIPGRHLPRLTERFYRVDKGRSRQSGGTGLGLAIVKHAVGRHGGELQIISEVGKGSSFTCNFPITRIITRPVPKPLQSASA